MDDIFAGFPGSDADGDSVNSDFDGELSVLEYARLHKLTTDYASQPTLTPGSLPSPDLTVLRDVDETDDNKRLAALAHLDLNEKFTVDTDTRVFLSEVLSRSPKNNSLDEQPSVRPSAKSLRLEAPILRTDHELDVRGFGKVHCPNLRDVKLPFEVTHADKEEGLDWPQASLDIPTKFGRQVAYEKLEGSRDMFLFLQDCLRNDGPGEVVTSTYKRNPAMDPVTPILMPLSPPTSPLMPCQDVGVIEMASSTTNSIKAEAEALEAVILANDAILPPSALNAISNEACPRAPDFGSQESMLLGGLSRSAHPTIFAVDTFCSPRTRKSDLKVEAPLTPTNCLSKVDSTPSKKVKTVAFPETLHEFIPELPSLYENGNDCLGSQNSFDEFFRDTVEPIAELVNRQIEQEQLQEVDTTRRVNIPIIDCTPPNPPWDIRGLPRDLPLSKIKKQDLTFMRHWPGVTKIERNLPWSPFPSRLGTVAIDEKIRDDKALAEMMSETAQQLICSSQLTWKPDGLRILDESDDSEVELEPATFDDPSEISALLKKRRLEIEANLSTSTDVPPSKRQRLVQPALDIFLGKAKPSNNAERATMAHSKSTIATKQDAKLQLGTGGRVSVVGPNRTAQKPPQGDLFSATTALHNFMQIQGTNITVTAEPSSNLSLHKPSFSMLDVVQNREQKASKAPDLTATRVPATSVDPPARIPPWPLPSPLPGTSMILSTNLLTHYRPLFRALQTLNPNMAFIERDFDSTISPAAEADIILSPATTVFLTSIQKIKQRSLPGQVNKAGVKTQIQQISERFERIIVFVGGISSISGKGVVGSSRNAPCDDSQQHDAATLDSSDSAAFVDLCAYCTLLPAEVIVTYVSGGLNHTAHAILNAQSWYGLAPPISGGSHSLLPDETLWELFLRRAGLNAYAAQSVLSMLKSSAEAHSQPLSGAPTKSNAVGLPAFIFMGHAEREAKFAALLGGTRILRQVGRLIDKGWPSAKNGFQGVGVWGEGRVTI